MNLSDFLRNILFFSVYIPLLLFTIPYVLWTQPGLIFRQGLYEFAMTVLGVDLYFSLSICAWISVFLYCGIYANITCHLFKINCDKAVNIPCDLLGIYC